MSVIYTVLTGLFILAKADYFKYAYFIKTASIGGEEFSLQLGTINAVLPGGVPANPQTS